MIGNQSTPSELVRHRIIGAAEAASLCGFSTAHFRKLYHDGRVPKPLLIGERKLGWRTGDLIDWIDAKAREAVESDVILPSSSTSICPERPAV